MFRPANSHVVLRHVPKVPNTPFCGQVVNLPALPSEEADLKIAVAHIRGPHPELQEL